MTVRRTFWGLLVVIAVAGVAGYSLPFKVFIPSKPEYSIEIFTRLIIFLVGLMVVGYAWARFSLSRIELHREARIQRQQVGQIFEERYRIYNNSSLPRLWLEIRDQSSLPGNFGSRVISMIGPRHQRTYVAYTMLFRRGAFHLGPTALVSGDPFGLFQMSRVLPNDQELLVLPYVVELSIFPAPAGQFPGGKAILRKATEVTPQAAGVREYFPGDALRSIHWATSARKDRLMVKEFEQDPQADVWIFLDAFQAVQVVNPAQPVMERIDQFWQLFKHERPKVQLPADTFEYGVSAAGSLASYYSKRGRSVGLICASTVLTVIPPERGERQLNKILENLAFLMGDGSLPILGLVDSQASQLPRASTVVIISPTTDSSLQLAVDSLLMRSMKPILVHIDAESFGGLPGGIELAERIRRNSIPVQVLRYEASLKESLEDSL